MPTGHAHRAAPRTHIIRARESCAALHQPVEVGRVNIREPHRANRLVAHIIGEDEQHIRLTRRAGKHRRGQENRQQEPAQGMRKGAFCGPNDKASISCEYKSSPSAAQT